MECKKCRIEMREIKELSRGMGNQRFLICPTCGLICLVSGDKITQSWPLQGDQEGEGNYESNRALFRLG